MIQRSLFNADHEAFRDSFARFIDKEIAPFHADWEEQGYVDREVWRKAGANGFLCMTMPEQYGGAGVDKRYSVVQMEEFSAAGFSGIGYGLHTEIVAPVNAGGEHDVGDDSPAFLRQIWVNTGSAER